MKKNILFSLILLMAFACTTTTQKGGEEDTADTTEMSANDEPSVTLSEVWATDTILATPEAVLYDREREIAYVSNINGTPPNAEDGDGFISKMNLQGEVTELQWVTGLDAPKGLGIHEGMLYVTDINELVEINIEDGEIMNRYPVEGATFLNDVTISPDGIVYFTDSDNASIHMLQNGEVSVFLQGDMLNRPNGLYWTEERLMLASSADNAVKAIDWETKEVTVLAEGVAHGDGIVPDGAGNFLVSNWAGQVFWLSPDMELVNLLDTTAEEINSADIDYVIDENLLLVPTFFDNRVVAYNLNKMAM